MKSWWSIVGMGVAMARTTKSQTQGTGKTFHLCGCWQCMQHLTVAVSSSWWSLSETVPLQTSPMQTSIRASTAHLIPAFPCVCLLFLYSWVALVRFPGPSHALLAAPLLRGRYSKITQVCLSDFKSGAREAILDEVLQTGICLCSEFVPAVSSYGLEKYVLLLWIPQLKLFAILCSCSAQ